MRAVLFSVFVCVAPAAAQNWFIPNSAPTTGTCNLVPFGSTAGSQFGNAKYQQRCPAALLGSAPNVITGLGFAACATGRAHYATIEIVLDHIPAAQPLSTTFASNLTPAAVTVLAATGYTWNLTAHTWNEIGLQRGFAWNGVDDVLVQVTTTGGLAPAGFHIGNLERIAWSGTTGPAPATGTSANLASKIEVSMLMARTSSHGDGCVGTNGRPLLARSGSLQPGGTASFGITNGLPGGAAIFVAGLTNAAPFPLPLAFVGAPGCHVYTDLTATAVVLLDGTGAGSHALAVPPGVLGFRFFAQYAVLDLAANPFGFTTSNYLNALTGN